MATRMVTADLEAENTFTDGILALYRNEDDGFLNISISGTWNGTVTLQRSFDNTTWHDVDSFTENYEASLIDKESVTRYRLGFKTDDYASGTATCRLGK